MRWLISTHAQLDDDTHLKLQGILDSASGKHKYTHNNLDSHIHPSQHNLRCYPAIRPSDNLIRSLHSQISTLSLTLRSSSQAPPAASERTIMHRKPPITYAATTLIQKAILATSRSPADSRSPLEGVSVFSCSLVASGEIVTSNRKSRVRAMSSRDGVKAGM